MPDDGSQDAFATDEQIYGRRSPRYLEGLEYLVGTLEPQDQKLDFAGRLCAATESFRLALNAQIALIADENWTILSRTPDDGALADLSVGRQMPWAGSPPPIDEQKGYRIDFSTNEAPIFNVIGLLSSVQAIVAHTPAKYYVVVCNSQHKDVPFVAMDGRVLRSLVSMLMLWDQAAARVGEKQGKLEATQSLTQSLYADARFRGEPSFLSRASEDLAALLFPTDDAGTHQDRSSKLEVSPDPDVVLADYLDSELAACLMATREKDGDSTKVKDKKKGKKKSKNRSRKSRSDLGAADAPGKQSALPAALDSRGAKVAPPPGGDTPDTSADADPPALSVLLDERATTARVDIQRMPRTALAAARVLMWQAYDRQKRAPQILGEKDGGTAPVCVRTRDTLPDELVRPFFWTIPEKILDFVHAEPPSALFEIDRLRTYWQRLHYLARNGRSEPKIDTLAECVRIYERVCAQTGRRLADYLVHGKRHVVVDSDWLLTWMISNTLASRPLSEYFIGQLKDSGNAETPSFDKPGMASPSNCMRYLLYLSECVLYALHCARHEKRRAEFRTEGHRKRAQRPPFADVPLALSPTLTEAQIYLVAQYAYHHIGVPRELCIYERLMRQYRAELFLYASGNLYRDHSYHAMDVCLLGELLLRSSTSGASGSPPTTFGEQLLTMTIASRSCEEECKEADHTVSDAPGDDASAGVSFDLFMCAWYVAALCHDLGYLYERVSRLVKPLGDIAGAGLQAVIDALQEGLTNGAKEALHTARKVAHTNCPELVSCLSNIDADDGSLDHGVAAWLHLCAWQKDSKNEHRCIPLALRAIARHNLTDHTLKASEEPLTALLILCDHIQEWGRPRVAPDALTYGVMESMRFSHPVHVENHQRVRQVRITGRCCTLDPLPDGPWRAGSVLYGLKRPKERIDLTLPHVDILGDAFEPAVSWLLWSRDLGCVNWGDSTGGLCGTITLTHAASRIWKDLSWAPLEMDLLQDFVATHEKAAALSLWIEKSKSGSDGFVYEGKRKEGKEKLKITLEKLNSDTRFPSLGSLIPEFQRWKWRQLSRQFLALNVGWWAMDDE